MEVEMTALTNTQTNAKTKTKLERSGNDRGGDGASVTSTSSSASLSLDDLLPPSKLYAGKCNDNDLDELLGIDMDEFQLREEQKQKQKLKKKQQQKQRRWCCTNTNTNTNTNTCSIRKSISCTRLGSTIILSQYCYDKFQWCIIGPQYIGLLFTLTLLHSATYFFTKQAYIHIGTISAAFCILFHILSTACLLCVSCRDPGIVRPRHYRNIHNKNNNNKKKKKRRNDQEYEGLMTNDDDDDDENDTNGNDDDNNNMADDMDMPLEEGWRFCALCNIHQPPKAVHCPECHVCVDGYDHHCPWMGCCVGKGNMKAFMLFNLSWLMYFLYAAIWVAFLGPMIFKKHRDQEF